MTDSTHTSALSEALSKRERRVHFFPFDFLLFPGKRIHGIGMWVASKAEDDAAIVAAHKYAFDFAKSAGEAAAGAREDTDLLTDAKTVEALYRVCREVDPGSIDAHPDEPSNWKITKYAAFRAPALMRDKLSTDEIAVLLNLYMEVKRRENPASVDISDEAIDALASFCNQHQDDDIPEAALSRYPRTFLTHAVVRLSAKLTISREAAETLLQDVEAREGVTASELQRLRAIERAARGVVDGGEPLDALRAAVDPADDAVAVTTDEGEPPPT